MRRRRRSRPLWFPPVGIRIRDTDSFTGAISFSIPVAPGGELTGATLPLTFDQGQENRLSQELTQAITLSDLMGSSWRLRRMIINVWASFVTEGQGALDFPAGTSVLSSLFSVGCMVLATDASSAPVKAATINPLERDDYTDPWVWRRVWLLGQGAELRRTTSVLGAFEGVAPNQAAVVTDEESAFLQFPKTNLAYGFLAGGTHIDQKTNRVIGPEERLFLVFGTKQMPIQRQCANSALIVGAVEYRLLGGLQRSSNRRNASR